MQTYRFAFCQRVDVVGLQVGGAVASLQHPSDAGGLGILLAESPGAAFLAQPRKLERQVPGAAVGRSAEAGRRARSREGRNDGGRRKRRVVRVRRGGMPRGGRHQDGGRKEVAKIRRWVIMIVLRIPGAAAAAAAARPTSAMGSALQAGGEGSGEGSSVGAKWRSGRRSTTTTTTTLRGWRQVEPGIGSIEEVGDSLHGTFSASKASALGSGQAYGWSRHYRRSNQYKVTKRKKNKKK